MSRADQFKRNAENAEHQAARAQSDAERVAYLRIAESWRELEAAARAEETRGY